MDSIVSCSDKFGRHILQDFLRKVLRLAANRLHDLCGRLDLQDANREEIETQVRFIPVMLTHLAQRQLVLTTVFADVHTGLALCSCPYQPREH